MWPADRHGRSAGSSPGHAPGIDAARPLPKRLRKKFWAVYNTFDIIETLYGVGYRFKESSAPYAAA
jgi:hypothetical protein